MKASELRLGNWVNSKIYGDYQIVGMTAFDENSNVFKSMEWYPKGNKIEDIHPIPITIEWLAKLGFGKSEEHEMGFNLNPNFGFYYDYHFQKLRVETENDDFELTNIYFIHQLQNLYFSLTGEELTMPK
jgi:hypothetical protein